MLCAVPCDLDRENKTKPVRDGTKQHKTWHAIWMYIFVFFFSQFAHIFQPRPANSVHSRSQSQSQYSTILQFTIYNSQFTIYMTHRQFELGFQSIPISYSSFLIDPYRKFKPFVLRKTNAHRALCPTSQTKLIVWLFFYFFHFLLWFFFSIVWISNKMARRI